jgi:hypothetical protein
MPSLSKYETIEAPQPIAHFHSNSQKNKAPH